MTEPTPSEPSGDHEFEPAPLADAFGVLVRRVMARSRKELSKAAERSRRSLELRQKRKDLDHFWVRLGKTAHRLVEGGEIDHPALRKAMRRIEELEEELDEVHASTEDVAQAGESE